MKYRPIGNSGLVVSAVGVGGNNFGRRLDREGTQAVVDAAIDAGVTLFDTADMYGDGDSERLLGASIGSRRDSVVIATKFGMEVGGAGAPEWLPRGSRGYISWAVEQSLQRLGTDYIDLLQYHEPDGITPIEETLAALTELVQTGKVRYIGCSNFAAWQLIRAAWSSDTRGYATFISTQERYHLLDRSVETEVVPACTELGMGILPYYPLANGLLSGKYRKGEPIPEGSRLSWREGWTTESAMDKVEALRAFGEQRGISLLEVAVGGLAAQPRVASVIAGAMTAEQVRQNARAANWDPTPEDLIELNAIVEPGVRIV